MGDNFSQAAAAIIIMTANIIRLILLICLISTSSGTNPEADRGECKPLPECEALLFLVQHKDEIPGMSRADVFKTLRDAMCGYEGKTPKVRN